MDIELKMPDLATTDSTIKVVRWRIEPGQCIQRGQILLEVETDKATMEVESIATGRLTAVRVEPGDEIIAGQVIAVIAPQDGATVPPTLSPATVPTQPASEPTRHASGSPGKVGGMFAQNRAASQKPVSAEPERHLDLGAGRRIVAQRMRESKQSIPHFYLQTSVNAEPMIARRAAAASDKIAWDAFFVSAIGKTLKKFERMCFRFEGDHLAAGGTDAVGVAVDNEGELYVIAVTDPAVKTPERISGEIRSAVEQLRAGDQEVRKLRPANMTVTNLGAANVETFTAIINPPEAAILAVGKVSPRAVVENGEIVVQNRVSITLSVDHRVVNGKYAADFLGAIVRELESF